MEYIVTGPSPVIDSRTMGDPSRHRSYDEIEQLVASLPPAPKQTGTVTKIIRRISGGVREILDEVTLTPEEGVPGDSWGRDPDRDTQAQIAVMQNDVAGVIANGQHPGLFGDSLFLDLDLSAANLPALTRIRLGAALLEVTSLPHNGCMKFRARFGDGALRFVSNPALRDRNYRGIYLRVLEKGTVRVGDPAIVE